MDITADLSPHPAFFGGGLRKGYHQQFFSLVNGREMRRYRGRAITQIQRRDGKRVLPVPADASSNAAAGERSAEDQKNAATSFILCFSLIRGNVCCNALTLSTLSSLSDARILLFHSGYQQSVTILPYLVVPPPLLIEEVGKLLWRQQFYRAMILSRGQSFYITPIEILGLNGMLLRPTFCGARRIA